MNNQLQNPQRFFFFLQQRGMK